MQLLKRRHPRDGVDEVFERGALCAQGAHRGAAGGRIGIVPGELDDAGFGVRLGTTDVKRPRASASAVLLKFAFIINLCV